jgi:hypothetical protein
MSNKVYSQSGELLSEDFGTPAGQHVIKTLEIKEVARRIITELEGDNGLELTKAQQQDSMDNGFRYQRLIHQIEIIRSRSNDLEAQLFALDDAKVISAFDIVTPMRAVIDVSDISVVFSKTQFQEHVRTVLDFGRLGAVINAAELAMPTNANVREVMEAYREGGTVRKQNAQELIGVFIQEGVEGFTQDDLTTVLSAWPTL